jgi:bifunctional UDP-N-acetylglucosamine pyrophosphorylase/glucosamine-1-phosphate N-acetyltransferase
MRRCVILAAGQGKRMQPLTFTRPKVMLPIANKPIIEWNLLKAKSVGINHFLFIIGYKSELVRQYFQDGSDWDVHIEYVNQGTPKGTIFGSTDIKAINNTSNSMGVCMVENPSDYGVVEIKNNQILKIHEKILSPMTDTINAGIYHFHTDIFKFIKKTALSKRGEYELIEAINLMVKDQPLQRVMIKHWKDISYPWDMFDANKELLDDLSPEIHGKIEPQTTLKGLVSIGNNTIVMNGSYIIGPVIIGSDCTIGPNCYIRPYSTIGNGCHVGAASEIKNSIIMDNSKIPHHNYVGDSVIGSGCNLGSGTKVANLRLDKKTVFIEHHGKRINSKSRKLGVIMGDNVQTGINSMINVGTIIGDHVYIGPGAIISGTIDPKSRIL